MTEHGFVLTNQRLIVLKVAKNKDKVVISFELQKEFPLDSVKDIACESRRIRIYSLEGTYEVYEVTPLWSERSNDPSYFRSKVMEEKGKKATILVDFTSLKSTLEKGGVALTTLTCPKCNAPLNIPTGGTETTCPHCGSVVYAQDIFKKLKTLLS
jgi:predicted RNA-binding Zn-ribbon protein involved in translation (DUF1610 family)